MKLWIALYHHRHGVDAYPFFQDEEPEEAQAITTIDENGGCYEGEGCREEEYQRDDEWIEVRGQWEVPAVTIGDELVASLQEMVAMAEPNIYPCPDKPNSKWGILCRAKDVLKKAGAI